MSFLSKEALMATRDHGVKEIPVIIDDQEHIAKIKVLNGLEAGEFGARFIVTANKSQSAQTKLHASFKAEYVARCLLNADGTAMFKTYQEAGALPAKVVEKLFNACTEVNPLGAEKDEVEKELKNSEETNEEDLSSDSP